MDMAGLYRKLLRVFPASFREEYEGPMERQFRDEQREASGWKENAQLWWRALADIAVSAPKELARELGQDARFALRVHGKRPLGATMAIGTMALAIGASTGVFSVASALLLRELPFREASRLEELRGSPFGASAGRAGFMEWREHNPYLESAATFSTSEMNLNSGRDALRVRVTETSANLFSLLGVRGVVGRTFAAGEDETGRNHVAVISHRLWQQVYGGDPGAMGSAIHLDGVALTIIGVTPARFDYPGDVDVWTPTVFDFETIPKHGAFIFQTIGRLRAGMSLPQAQQLFKADVAHASPESLRNGKADGPELAGLRDQLSAQIRQSVLILFSVVLLVLLTASANVAQLLLARTGERYRELAVRSALGASRSRLIQQLTVEATALTLAGCVLGMAVAFAVARVASVMLPAQLAAQEYTLLDWHVLCFALGLALVTGVLLGMLPAWLIGSLQPATQLGGMSLGSSGPVRTPLRAVLMSLQVAFTLVLLVSSLSLGSAFLRLMHTELGFRATNAVTLRVSLEGTRYRTGAARWAYYSEVQKRLRSVHGVLAAGAVNYLPLSRSVLMGGTVQVESGARVGGVILNGSMPGYFEAMASRVLAGSDFRAGAGQTGEPPVIVNEAFARQSGLGTGIVGRKILSPWTTRPYVVAGVVTTARMGGPEYEGGPQVYWPVEEDPGPSLTFVARVSGDARRWVAECRDAVSGIDRGVPVYEAKTLEERLSETMERPRFYTTSVLFLACLALLIAITGVYGTSSRAIAQRRHELGLRVALGASTGQIRGLIVREELLPVSAGVAAGLTGAAGCGVLLRHLFEGIRILGGSAYWGASLFLVCFVLVTAWGATYRILAIDPLEAIRSE